MHTEPQQMKKRRDDYDPAQKWLEPNIQIEIPFRFREEIHTHTHKSTVSIIWYVSDRVYSNWFNAMNTMNAMKRMNWNEAS